MPAQDSPPPTKGEFCVCLCICVCASVLCLAKCPVARVFSGCFRARSARMLVCVYACVCACVRTGSVVGHDSKEGFRTHGSEFNRRPKGQIQLSTVLLPLSLSLTVFSSSPFSCLFLKISTSQSTARFIRVCICMRACLVMTFLATVTLPHNTR